jgi:hypothetical protein
MSHKNRGPPPVFNLGGPQGGPTASEWLYPLHPPLGRSPSCAGRELPWEALLFGRGRTNDRFDVVHPRTDPNKWGQASDSPARQVRRADSASDAVTVNRWHATLVYAHGDRLGRRPTILRLSALAGATTTAVLRRRAL